MKGWRRKAKVQATNAGDAKNDVAGEVPRPGDDNLVGSEYLPFRRNGKASLLLAQGGSDTEYLAFKVKSTHPDKYLVRPSHGLIAPGNLMKLRFKCLMEEEQILAFSEKGNGTTRHKFLIQSCLVPEDDVEAAIETGADLDSALEEVWVKYRDSVTERKMRARHVARSTSGSGSSQENLSDTENGEYDRMSSFDSPRKNERKMLPLHDDLRTENESLRRKYEELVAMTTELIKHHGVAEIDDQDFSTNSFMTAGSNVSGRDSRRRMTSSMLGKKSITIL